jgi:hypothetical protein
MGRVWQHLGRPDKQRDAYEKGLQICQAGGASRWIDRQVHFAAEKKDVAARRTLHLVGFFTKQGLSSGSCRAACSCRGELQVNGR